ncbi:hypothetical protein WG66_014185 [Moniliophthora roreri]|nr:hypothetical protein WG66_014185 [Moniliophthora roreri]
MQHWQRATKIVAVTNRVHRAGISSLTEPGWNFDLTPVRQRKNSKALIDFFVLVGQRHEQENTRRMFLGCLGPPAPGKVSALETVKGPQKPQNATGVGIRWSVRGW